MLSILNKHYRRYLIGFRKNTKSKWPKYKVKIQKEVYIGIRTFCTSVTVTLGPRVILMTLLLQYVVRQYQRPSLLERAANASGCVKIETITCSQLQLHIVEGLARLSTVEVEISIATTDHPLCSHHRVHTMVLDDPLN